jgi:NAD(P)-dependent dehydrogenase (short-subunit alcohol dehydrogenase family)
MSSRLDGRRALITGGANGLGAATAELFAAEGAKVVIADLESAADAAAKVVDRIVSAGGLAMYQPMDVRDAGLVREGIDEAAAWMGGIDSVVASAGLGGPPGQAGSFRTMLDLDVEHFDVVYDVNVRGVFLTCQRAAQLMVDAGVDRRQAPDGGRLLGVEGRGVDVDEVSGARARTGGDPGERDRAGVRRDRAVRKHGQVGGRRRSCRRA